MLGAGLTLLQALAILERQTENRKFREILKQVRTDVEGDGLLRGPLQAQDLLPPLREPGAGGETSGGLDLILDRLASFLEKELELRGKIRSAMTYPVIVFVFAVGVAYFLLTGIVPQFAQILTDLGSELPSSPASSSPSPTFLGRPPCPSSSSPWPSSSPTAGITAPPGA